MSESTAELTLREAMQHRARWAIEAAGKVERWMAKARMLAEILLEDPPGTTAHDAHAAEMLLVGFCNDASSLLGQVEGPYNHVGLALDQIVQKEMTPSVMWPEIADLPLSRIKAWADAIPSGETARSAGVTAPPETVDVG